MMMTQVKNFVLPMRVNTARGLSLFVLVTVLIGYFAELAVPDLPQNLGKVFVGFRLAGLMAAIALFLSTWGQQSMAGDRMIDERQQRERDRAFTLTHRFMVFTAIIAFFYIDLSNKLALPLPDDPRDAAGLINAYVLLSLALPGIILAWQAPTDAVEDEE
jgi:hypothetical protein